MVGCFLAIIDALLLIRFSAQAGEGPLYQCCCKLYDAARSCNDTTTTVDSSSGGSADSVIWRTPRSTTSSSRIYPRTTKTGCSRAWVPCITKNASIHASTPALTAARDSPLKETGIGVGVQPTASTPVEIFPQEKWCGLAPFGEGTAHPPPGLLATTKSTEKDHHTVGSDVGVNSRDIEANRTFGESDTCMEAKTQNGYLPRFQEEEEESAGDTATPKSQEGENLSVVVRVAVDRTHAQAADGSSMKPPSYENASVCVIGSTNEISGVKSPSSTGYAINEGSRLPHVEDQTKYTGRNRDTGTDLHYDGEVPNVVLSGSGSGSDRNDVQGIGMPPSSKVSITDSLYEEMDFDLSTLGRGVSFIGPETSDVDIQSRLGEAPRQSFLSTGTHADELPTFAEYLETFGV